MKFYSIIIFAPSHYLLIFSSDKTIFPGKHSITPFANITKYDPNDYYDLSPHPAFPLSPKKGIYFYIRIISNFTSYQ